MNNNEIELAITKALELAGLKGETYIITYKTKTSTGCITSGDPISLTGLWCASGIVIENKLDELVNGSYSEKINGYTVTLDNK